MDKETGESIRLTVAEKERIYLDALQSFYFSNRELLPQADFDILKEDLAWSGSSVVILNRKETRFLAAEQDYARGEMTMTDEEFDKLKLELKADNSKIVVSTEPKCYIDTGVCR